MKKYTPQEADIEFERHPYFVNPQVSALAGASSEKRQEIVRRIAAMVGDPCALRTLLGIDPEEFTAFYPDMVPPELTTEDTIDTFLRRFSGEDAVPASGVSGDARTPVVSEGKADAPEKEAMPAEDLIPGGPAIDYASMYIAEEDGETEFSEKDSTSELLTSFLTTNPPARQPRRAQPERQPERQPVGAAEGGDSHKLAESLAKVMVKNGNYRKALEIITDLSLKNPKKSIYFADQMRFLRKLIANQERRNAR